MKNIFLLACLILPGIAYGQTPAIANVLPEIRVFPSARAQSEESISINKNNPNEIIVSANVTPLSPLAFTQSLYHSLDGGITWSAYGGSDVLPNQASLPSGESPGGDPATCFDASGTGYLVGILKGSTTGADGYFVETTNDGGSTWNSPVRGNVTSTSNFDKEMITAVDEMSTSPYANNFYCAWINFNNGMIAFNRLTAGSTTFSTPIKISHSTGGSDQTTGTSIQTGPDGQVYICWTDYPSGIGATPGKFIGFNSFTDGGVTPVTNPATTSTDIFSYSGIRTLANNADPSFGNIRINDFPVMAVDKSCGPHRGRIYIAYPEFDGTGAGVINVRFSDDQGTTWSSEVQASIVASTYFSLRESAFPAIAVDDLTGLVSIAYFGTDAPKSSNTWNTYLAYSTDGAATWQNALVGFYSHSPVPIPNMAANYAGDYIGIASYAGKSFIAWHDNRASINVGNPTPTLWNTYVAEVDYSIPIITSSTTDLNITYPSLPANYITGNATFQATDYITAGSSDAIGIGSGARVNFFAGKSIILNPGYFTAQSNSVFLAEITPISACQTPGSMTYKTTSSSFAGVSANSNDNILKDTGTYQVYAYPIPANDYITIGCYSSKDAHTITITDMSGRILMQTPVEVYNYSQIRNVIDVSKLSPGSYLFTIDFYDKTYSNKFIKL